MILTFYSNFLNHHQLPLDKELYNILGDDYKFVATTPTPSERIKLGYEDMNKKYPFVITTYDSNEGYEKAKRLAIESDVIIIGSAPDEYIKKRIERNKLTFRYSERLYKKRMNFSGWIHAFLSTYLHFERYNKAKFYMLCASAYTAADLNKFFSFKNKTYKWGYFTEVKRFKNIKTVINEKKPQSILWTGRIIDWKHTEVAISIAEKLKNNGYNFIMNIIGTGDMEEDIKQLIIDKGVTGFVHMLGAMSPSEVRKHMENTEIFLFTSDFNEGWGAVLNEAMNSGCACVVSHAVGAAPYLINNGENGFLYKNSNINDLYEKITYLINNPENRIRMGIQAYKTMSTLWSPECAARRFIKLAQGILNGEICEFDHGPCSRAEILKNNWM